MNTHDTSLDVTMVGPTGNNCWTNRNELSNEESDAIFN